LRPLRDLRPLRQRPRRPRLVRGGGRRRRGGAGRRRGARAGAPRPGRPVRGAYRPAQPRARLPGLPGGGIAMPTNIDVGHAGLRGLDLHEFAHYVQPTDPGAVGPGLYWLDTSSAAIYVLRRRNAGNSAWVTLGGLVNSLVMPADLDVVGPTDGVVTVAWNHTAEALLLGAGTGALAELPPGAAGQVVRSTGLTWAAGAIAAGDLPGVPTDAQTGTAYALAPGDLGKLVTLANAGAVTAHVPQAGTLADQLPATWWCYVVNEGAGTATLTMPAASVITALAINTAGSGGTNGTFADGAFTGGGGTGGAFSYTVAGGVLTSVTLTAGGSGYTGAETATFPSAAFAVAPTLTLTLGGASTIDGATALALATGQGVTLVSDGTNYATVRGTGGGGAATLSVGDGTTTVSA